MKRNDEKRNLHIQCAFKSDCEDLLNDYCKLRDLSYTAFAKVWTARSFSLIFSGKASYEELRNFTESCFFTVKKFFVYSKDVHVKVGALYLLYGLYYKQPLKGFVKIRLTMSEYSTILNLIKEMETRQQLDAVYIFTKMKKDDIFDYVRVQTPMAPDLNHFADLFRMKDDIFQRKAVGEIETELKAIFKNEDVMKMGEQYRNAVREYAAISGETSLMTFNSNILKELGSIYKDELGEDVEEDEKEKKSKKKEKNKKEDDIGSRRKSIKEKAMRNKSSNRINYVMIT